MSVRSGFEAMMARKYALWGRDTVIAHPMTGDDLTLRLIDATTGIEVGDEFTVGTVSPAALVRKADLTTATLSASDLVGTTFTLNGATWRVQSTQPKPTVHGAEYGEVVLLLSRASD